MNNPNNLFILEQHNYFLSLTLVILVTGFCVSFVPFVVK